MTCRPSLLTPGDKKVKFLFKDRKIQFLKCKADAFTMVVPIFYACIKIIILNLFKLSVIFKTVLIFLRIIF